jgi:hypothetical protein
MNKDTIETKINTHSGYIQNTLKSLSNLAQKVNQIEKVYRWGLKFHLKEAWIAERDTPEDAELLKKIKVKNETIIFLKAKINISCTQVNKDLLKQKKDPSVSKALQSVFCKDGPISGFSFVESLTEGYSYAHVILAIHVKDFAGLVQQVKFINEAQKKIDQHLKIRANQDNSHARKYDFSLMNIPEYALVVEQISRHEDAIADLIKQKHELEKKHKNKSNKTEPPWPISGNDLNTLLNLKNRIPLKNRRYKLY